jgi:4-amino-4-deoxy-L-arabinose transferase-like glycosyltransferase
MLAAQAQEATSSLGDVFPWIAFVAIALGGAAAAGVRKSNAGLLVLLAAVVAILITASLNDLNVDQRTMTLYGGLAGFTVGGGLVMIAKERRKKRKLDK